MWVVRVWSKTPKRDFFAESFPAFRTHFLIIIWRFQRPALPKYLYHLISNVWMQCIKATTNRLHSKKFWGGGQKLYKSRTKLYTSKKCKKIYPVIQELYRVIQQLYSVIQQLYSLDGPEKQKLYSNYTLQVKLFYVRI